MPGTGLLTRKKERQQRQRRLERRFAPEIDLSKMGLVVGRLIRNPIIRHEPSKRRIRRMMNLGLSKQDLAVALSIPAGTERFDCVLRFAHCTARDAARLAPHVARQLGLSRHSYKPEIRGFIISSNKRKQAIAAGVASVYSKHKGN